MRRNSSSISLRVVRLAVDELGELVGRVGDGVGDRRAADQAMTGPSCRPLVRSHSQALSRAGRPNVSRKPLGSSTPESGSAAARVPGGTPGNFETEPVTR